MLVALIWADDDPSQVGAEELHASVSQDGGRTFGPELSLAPMIQGIPGARLLAATVAVFGDDVVVVHADDAESLAHGGPGGSDGARSYACVSNDRGASWTLGIPLTSGADEPVNRPLIAAGGSGGSSGSGSLQILVEVGHAGSNRLATCLSPDGGRTFSYLVEIPGLDTDVDTEDVVEGNSWAASSTSTTTLLGFWDQATGSNELYVAGNGALPTLLEYCEATPNSTGAPARIGAQGMPFLTGGPFVLTADSVPETTGVFFFASNPSHHPFGDGWMCAHGQFHFLWPATAAVGGHAERVLDMSGPGISAGQRYFQYWFRDPIAGGAYYSTSNALAVLFQ